jgi:hypothetical protein
MGEALEGLDVVFTALFASGLVVLTFIVAGAVAVGARCWVRRPTALGIGVLAGAWSGFMSAGEILKNFDWPVEQLCPLLVFGLATCAARLLLPWSGARRAWFVVAVLILTVQAVFMAGSLIDLSAGRLTGGSGYPLCVPRPAEWWVLAAPVPVLLTGLVVLIGLGYRSEAGTVLPGTRVGRGEGTAEKGTGSRPREAVPGGPDGGERSERAG